MIDFELGIILYFLFGNLIIGILEGLIMTRLTNLSKKISIRLMISSNYILGVVSLAFLNSNWLENYFLEKITIYNYEYYFYMFFLVLYGVSSLCKWPFIQWIYLRKWDKALKKSILTTIFFQGFSFLIMFSWYSHLSDFSLLQTDIVSPTQIKSSNNVVIYIFKKNDKIYQRNFVNNQLKEIHDQKGINFTQPVYGNAKQLGEANQSLWRFATGIGKNPGFYILQGPNQFKSKVLSLRTVFNHYKPGRAIHLPDDLVLFQMGHQILLFNPNTNQLALFDKGVDFTVVENL